MSISLCILGNKRGLLIIVKSQENTIHHGKYMKDTYIDVDAS